MAEFMSDNIRDPAVAAADFKIPVGEPKIHCIFARDGASVAVKSVVQDGAHATGKRLVVTASDRIVNGFGVGGNFRGVR